MLERVSVRVLVPVLIALPVAAVGGVVGWIAVDQAGRSTEELAGRVVEQIGARIEQRVGAQVRMVDRASRVGEALVRRGVYRPGELRSWLGPMVEQMGAFEELAGIAWGEPSGDVVWVAEYPGDAQAEFAVVDGQTRADPATAGKVVQWAIGADGVLREPPKGAFAYELFTRPWYVVGAAAPAGQAAWSAVYSWARDDGTGETLGISYARGVRGADGALIGVLDTELELVQFSRFLATLEIGEGGLALIAERGGRLVAASRGQSLLGVEGERRMAWEAEDAATRALGAALRERLEGGNGEGVARVLVGGAEDAGRGEAWWVRVAGLRDAAGLEWVGVVGVPERSLVASVRAMQARALRAGLVAAGLAVLGGMVVGGLAARPIVRLRDRVARIGAGDLETRGREGGAAEIVELSAALTGMQEGLKDRMRLRKSMELAMEVQQALLPSGPPRVAGLDVAGQSVYCDETGGDYYDYLKMDAIGAGALGVALGDVMGHGVAAALLMASARAVLRSRAGESGSLASLLTHLNGRLVEDTGGSRFMTLLLMAIEPASGSGPGRVRYATAGQGPPMVLRARTGVWEELETGGMPLGLEASESYEERAVEGLEAGDVLLAATDGLWESDNERKEAFGLDRVRGIVEEMQGRPAAEIAGALDERLRAFCHPRKPEDDVTFVVVRVVGA
jgi:sigma-B regulation protein RsbU (phosphoserine phosphatase)